MALIRPIPTAGGDNLKLFSYVTNAVQFGYKIENGVYTPSPISSGTGTLFTIDDIKFDYIGSNAVKVTNNRSEAVELTNLGSGTTYTINAGASETMSSPVVIIL